MADFNQVGRPDLAGAVGRLYGVDKPRTSVVGGEINVTTSPWERPEFWALMGGSLAWGYAQKTAGANTARVQLFNASNTGVLGILEGIILYNNAAGGAQKFRWGLHNTALITSTGSWVNRDMRRAATTGGGGALAMRIRTEDQAAPVWDTILGEISLPATSCIWLPLDMVLPPGWGWSIIPLTAAVAMECTLIGRERFSPAAELTNL